MQLGLQVRFPNLVCKKKPSLMIPYLYLLSLFSFSNLSYSFTPYSFSLLSAFCLHVLTLAHLSTFCVLYAHSDFSHLHSCLYLGFWLRPSVLCLVCWFLPSATAFRSIAWVLTQATFSTYYHLYVRTYGYEFSIYVY